MTEPTLWGIHAGRTGDAHTLFTKKNVVALGWDRIGDLTQLGASREAFKAAVAKAYPDSKPGAIAVSAGQLFRFVHELQIGDLVAYPSQLDRKINLGKVTGAYYSDASGESSYPNRRQVVWLNSVPRKDFSQGALYEIGSAMSFFQLKTYSEEFVKALQGKVDPTPVKEDPTVAIVAADIEQTTRDFIVKTLSQELKGHPLSHFVAQILNTMGYRTRISPAGTDGGVDILAHRDELGFEPPIIKVQVKSGDGKVGDPEVSSLYGKVGANEYGMLVTLGSYTAHAVSFARNKTNLRLIDGDDLVNLVLAHYEQLDSRYKGILPLKKVYIPAPVEEED